MEAINDILLANNKAKGGRPFFLEDPAVEKVLAITMAIAGELAVCRERLDSLERILESKGQLSRKEIENFSPDKQAAEERQRWHAEYIARILRIVQQEMEAMKDPEGNKPIEEIIDQLSKS